jgi:hypothetical protein
MGELARVAEIDRRKINNSGNTLSELQAIFRTLTETEGESLPF